MDADRIRALIPTFSWGIPTMAAFRPHDPLTSAVLRFPADHFGILLILTAPGEQPRTLPMRTAFLFHHRLSPTGRDL